MKIYQNRVFLELRRKNKKNIDKRTRNRCSRRITVIKSLLSSTWAANFSIHFINKRIKTDDHRYVHLDRHKKAIVKIYDTFMIMYGTSYYVNVICNQVNFAATNYKVYDNTMYLKRSNIYYGNFSYINMV